MDKCIEDIRVRRAPLAIGLRDNPGFLEVIAEHVYPDKAHFINELLQNAEDTGASRTEFILSDAALVFEHDGRPFDCDDIDSITTVKSSKRDKGDQIGQFGVGFKSVFAYTKTPRIWSPTFNFEIVDFVLPQELPAALDIGPITRFEFPFNCPKKSAVDACLEVIAGLEAMAEETLLFLSHIQNIRWQIDGGKRGEIRRVSHSEYHIEIIKTIDGSVATSAHYLRFEQPVEGLPKQRVALAFELLDILPSGEELDRTAPLNEQFRIVSANPGRVAIFFVAEKEVSGLRFHVHAPFVPELSRASLKDTSANDPLFEQLAGLAASSLPTIRDLGLLTGDFLATLPNDSDDIPKKYQCIRDSIIASMNEHPLTPTNEQTHAPARLLRQAKASLKSLLSTEDLQFLVDDDELTAGWAVGAAQRNSPVDRFLSSLDIRKWDVDQLVRIFNKHLGPEFDHEVRDWVHRSDPIFLNWLSAKSDDWHQKMYAMFWEESQQSRLTIGDLQDLPLIRLSTGGYSCGSQCYFPADDVEQDDVLPRVAKAVYTSGKSKAEQENAKKLLEEIGVREVGEAVLVEVILKDRYSNRSVDHDKYSYANDLKRFVSLVESEPQKAEIFEDYFIFEGADGSWRQPREVYIDAPFHSTGLAEYFEVIGEDANRVAIAPNHHEWGIEPQRIASFAEAVGAQVSLLIEKQPIDNHPLMRSMPSNTMRQRRGRKTFDDWNIPGLEKVLARPSKTLSRLVWNSLMQAEPRDFTAQFPCAMDTTRSTLAYLLESSAWIPHDGVFVRPPDARRELLPEGYSFDSGWEWLKKIRFGEEVSQSSDEHEERLDVARELGFDDVESLADATWFAKLQPDERRRLKAEYDGRRRTELPENEPYDSERRAARVGEQAADAPERATEYRTRSVSVGVDDVKKQTAPYLRLQYTNSDGEMICQICKDTTPLPFKLADGKYYFDAVEFLPELRKRHYQNYLALCPNHAAMFRWANASRDAMKELFLRFTDDARDTLDVVLAGETVSIYFTKTHVADLKVVVQNDEHQEIGANGDDV